MSENKLNVIDLHKRYGEHEVLIGEKYLSALH